MGTAEAEVGGSACEQHTHDTPVIFSRATGTAKDPSYIGSASSKDTLPGRI